MSGFGNLLSYSLQLAMLAGAALLLPLILRLRVPRTVHGYLQVVLALCLVLPVVQPWREIHTAAAVSLHTWTQASGGQPAAVCTLDWPERILTVLAAGTILRLLWLAAGLWRLRLYRRRAQPVESLPPGVLQMRSRLGVDAEFFTSCDVGGPVTFGLFRPVVLVPQSFVGMNTQSQEAVACHELLHVRRRDWAFTLAEEVLRSVFWFHPPLMWLIERIRATREQIVDALVVGWTGARRHYIQALLSMASAPARTDLLAPSFARKHHLKERVTLLLRESSMSKRRLAVTLAAVGLGTVLAVALAVRYFPLLRPAAPLELVKEKSIGTVTVAADLHSDGTIGNIRVVKSLDPEHDQIAIEQMRKKKVPSEAVSSEGTLTVEYTFVKGRSTPPAARISFTPDKGVPAVAKPDLAADRVYRVKEGVAPPRVIHKLEPKYTQQARDSKLQGTVVLYAEVSPAGMAENIKVLKSLDAGLDANAIAAVKQWKFQPGTKDGRPVRVAATVEINFRLM